MIDTHCHLDMLKTEEDLKESVEKLDFLLTIGCDKEEIKKAVELANKYENVYASIGFHPYDIKDITDKDLEELKDTIQKEKKVIAVGEFGLDYYRDYTPKDKQKYFFERQIEIAKQLNLPIIIHSREAPRDTEKILEKYAPYPASGIIHCFGGDMQMMEKCVDMGFYISFAGNITYPKAENLREIAKKVPLNRLLLETDSPFLAPQKKRGKPNKPSYIYYTRDFVANLLGLTPEELEKITDQNAKNVLKLS
ncbi:TatD family hydrolase [Hydrogenothermus marinus]|uniref:TatD DNase family protein n=1 Tax=Hydrogenothermus marinus TaxID=133270 RepID=A0A3M0C2C1_9AQUI|nr:TatD family hydrolase [Hydrogenothermus marinus]RMA97092.1 TatD DNase family protein [Hydrogenothermus marinus]